MPSCNLLRFRIVSGGCTKDAASAAALGSSCEQYAAKIK
jgi:hypothetical protein